MGSSLGPLAWNYFLKSSPTGRLFLLTGVVFLTWGHMLLGNKNGVICWLGDSHVRVKMGLELWATSVLQLTL